MTRPQDCARFDSCNSPLCPLVDPAHLARLAWFPDEDVCPVQAHGSIPFVQRQKKIQKATRRSPDVGCFDVAMLTPDYIVKSGITGLSPDEGELTETRVKAWLAKHPEKTPLTPEQRQQARQRFKKNVLHTGETLPSEAVRHGVSEGTDQNPSPESSEGGNLHEGAMPR